MTNALWLHRNYLKINVQFDTPTWKTSCYQYCQRGHGADSGRHWETASAIGTQPGHIKIYDSLYCDLPFSTEVQNAAIVCSSGAEVCPHIQKSLLITEDELGS